MRYFLAACFLGLGLGVALGLLLVMLGDAWESFDPNDAPALLSRPPSDSRALRSRTIESGNTLTTARPDENPTSPSQLSRDQGRHTRCAAC